MMRVDGKRVPLLFMSAVLVVATAGSAFIPKRASADQITNRSLTLLAGATDGGSKPGGVVRHQFDFTLPNIGSGNVGSIKFEYCTIASGTCTLPTGVVTTAATLDNQAGATGFTLNNATNGAPYLTRTAATIAAGQAVSYRLASVTNPTAENAAFYVRISTYASTDTTGTPIDSGTVVASTATQIQLQGIMPESLIFCTARNIDLNVGGVPDCSTATDGAVTFNQLFSPSDTATATSEMAASTNATFGYAITVNGTTLTSGTNTINPITAAGGSASITGTGQFGMNLLANATPAVGTAITPASDNTDLWAQAAGDYAVADRFKFASGEVVANSNSNATNSQIMTASYIVNVPGNQPAGTYVTTLTYVATATF